MNEILEEIRLHEDRIRDYSTNLRCELEELAECVRQLWIKDEKYYSPTGTELEEEDIQDYANEVSAIEVEFENN